MTAASRLLWAVGLLVRFGTNILLLHAQLTIYHFTVLQKKALVTIYDIFTAPRQYAVMT